MESGDLPSEKRFSTNFGDKMRPGRNRQDGKPAKGSIFGNHCRHAEEYRF